MVARKGAREHEAEEKLAELDEMLDMQLALIVAVLPVRIPPAFSCAMLLLNWLALIVALYPTYAPPAVC